MAADNEGNEGMRKACLSCERKQEAVRSEFQEQETACAKALGAGRQAEAGVGVRGRVVSTCSAARPL